MTDIDKGLTAEELREFMENPYSPDHRKPEDIVRLFYVYNVPVIPVVSKRGILLGVLKKEDVVSELSDIEKVENVGIDRFITGVAKKMTLDEVLPYGAIREFLVINIFGEVQGTWSRLQFFTASESSSEGKRAEEDVEKQKEEQILEWIIYLILEHIPRPLYAVNKNGKTIFYNSHFEDIYQKSLKGDVDVERVEAFLKSSNDNELISGKESDELHFYNRPLKIYYEKVPLLNKRKKVGYLMFFDKVPRAMDRSSFAGVNVRGMSLNDIISALEREIIVDALRRGDDIGSVAEAFKISKGSLAKKIERHGIDAKKIQK